MISRNFIISLFHSYEKRSLLTCKSVLKTLNNCFYQRVRCFSVIESLEGKQEEDSPKKILKVAILGLPNAGKSTLINTIIKMNLCDVSPKCHTTQLPVRAAYVYQDTQIVFVDTPGITVRKHVNKFNLSPSFVNWKKKVLKEVDIIGVVYDANYVMLGSRLNHHLMTFLEEHCKGHRIFLLINKVDLIKDEIALLDRANKLIKKYSSGKSESSKSSKEEFHIQFDKVFYISALEDSGVDNIVGYLLEKAKPGKWLLGQDQITDLPLNVFIENLIRAGLLTEFEQEIPYLMKCRVEYLKENNLGELICVILVTCKKVKHAIKLKKNKRLFLRAICQTVESEFYAITKKVIRIRLVVS